ncbi:hypothetical protein ACTXT7_017064, partial [Hymenolepis weldensis]
LSYGYTSNHPMPLNCNSHCTPSQKDEKCLNTTILDGFKKAELRELYPIVLTDK